MSSSCEVSIVKIQRDSGRMCSFKPTFPQVAQLAQHGYSEDAPKDSGKRLLMRRDGPAGFPQVYVLDPDGHVVEINASA